ncbi:DUF6545 domain-containing protein [Streptomyces sp. MMBL 11-3]|uniref:DUF6545 domain-containing protein n=1 Tax=Streptomyces sp. MMBL 11-3 TaxID=3382639 RepID=UPI0039B6D70C
MTPTSLYLIPIVLLCVAFLVHLPVRQKWQVPVIRSGYAVLLIGALTLFHAQPAVIEEVNALTGVANFSAPLVYALNTAFSGACLALVINWRGGEAHWLRRVWLRCLSLYSICAATVVILFVLGSAPVERTTDFDSYYATTPYIREMILLYLAAHSVAMITMLWLCATWQREVHGMLRAGLLLIVIGACFDIAGFQAAKYASVAARWGGRDLDFLSTSVAPVAVSIAAFLVALGFILPRASSQWEALRTYRDLDRLRAALRHVDIPVPPASAWWLAPTARLTRREATLHDALLHLNPHFSREVFDEARAGALAAGHSPAAADVAAQAAVVVRAVRAYTADLPPTNASGTYQLQATQGGAGALAELSRALPDAAAGPGAHSLPASPRQP